MLKWLKLSLDSYNNNKRSKLLRKESRDLRTKNSTKLLKPTNKMRDILRKEKMLTRSTDLKRKFTKKETLTMTSSTKFSIRVKTEHKAEIKMVKEVLLTRSRTSTSRINKRETNKSRKEAIRDKAK